MKWQLLFTTITAENLIKPHVVSDELKQCIIEDLNSRGIREIQEKLHSEVLLDVAGPMWRDRHHHVFKIDDLMILIPSCDFSVFFRGISKCQKRNFKGVEYFKIHAGYVALVLSPTQHKTLLDLMASELQEANAIAESEDSAMAEISQKMMKKGYMVPAQNKIKKGAYEA